MGLLWASTGVNRCLIELYSFKHVLGKLDPSNPSLSCNSKDY